MPPYGRGGAGNIQVPKEQEPNNPNLSSKTPLDLEANRSPSLDDAVSAQVLADGLRARKEQQQAYTHTGRGGMGNFVEAKGLIGGVSMGERSGVSVVADGVGTYGRGGVGNREYGDGVSKEEKSRREKFVKEEEERVRSEVEKGVGEILAVPAKAKIAVRRGRGKGE